MAYASRAGRARASANRPRAFAVCDRCGIWYNHDTLGFQFEWAGIALVNKRLLVCKTCLDRPHPQLKVVTTGPDPLPILNPRPEHAIEAYTDYRATDLGPVGTRHGIPIPGGDIRTTQLHDRRTTQMSGDRWVGPPRYTSTGAERRTEDGRLRVTEQQRP
jgi:hypothetical protein